MGLSYGWQNFHKAILSLSGDSPLRQRVINAIQNLHTVKPGDLPEDLRDEFDAFWKEMTSVQGNLSEGSIAATVNSLSDERLKEVSVKIVHMHDDVCRAYGK
jgi:hypothetical protein